MPQQIKLRRGTASEWTSADPVLGEGEPGFETDTGKVKFGDGSTAWTSLAYFGGTGSGTVDTAGTPTANDIARFTDADTIEGLSYAELRSAAGLVANTGDETIAGVKTFSSAPLVPGPTTEFQAATKGYVDQTALLDSEVDADIKTLSLPANTTISAFGATLVDDADAATARATLGVPAATEVATTVVLTAAEYAALSPPDSETIYFIVG